MAQPFSLGTVPTITTPTTIPFYSPESSSIRKIYQKLHTHTCTHFIGVTESGRERERERDRERERERERGGEREREKESDRESEKKRERER